MRNPPATRRPGLGIAAAIALHFVAFPPAAPAEAAHEGPAEAGAAVAHGAADPPGMTTFAPTRRPARAGFALRLRDSRARHHDALAALRERLAAADRAARPALQREIEALKRAHEADLLALQAERARADGRGELLVSLERRLAALRARGAEPARAGERGAR